MLRVIRYIGVILVSVSLASPCSSLVDAAHPGTDPPGAAEPASPDEWYGAGVRPTEARTPEEERTGFHLPPGFEVRLFAAEPEIKKPMNLAFDASGRLWVTDTVEYPYPAPDDRPGRDSVRVLEDTDGDGRADRVTTFADDLNIPIGVLPYGDGCICYSIPNLWYLRDTDGDGKCDRRELVVGPFDTTRDTHGMVNSLRAGSDGWIYACHGFNNQSRVAGTDGHEVTLVSGNTFRFRPDGSRVEHVTWGQVNPFGMTVDDWGYYYSADCHSKPISQLIRGGYYPSFGRPDDGLGFIPPMMDHLHGSTAIAGLAYFPPALGIEPLAEQMLSGNVMTSRINRNHLHRHGATVQGEKLPDFMTSDDPWFRPVDIRLGPDDHIYVADFYNRIIGHYEVPLEHPQRDRHRGRIWQIRRSDAARPKVEPQDAEALRSLDSAALADSLRGQLGDPNPERRHLALATIASHDDQKIRDAVRQLATDQTSPSAARISALWCLYRWQETDEPTVRQLADDPAPQVRTHLYQMLGELTSSPDAGQHRPLVIELSSAALDDPDANVTRAAAETLGRVGSSAHLHSLLSLLVATDRADAILRQTVRIAIRDTLTSPTADSSFLRDWPIDQQDSAMTAELASIALALDSESAGHFLVDYLRSGGPDEARAVEMLHHAASLVSAEELSELIHIARRLARDAEFDEAGLLEQITVARRADRANLPEPIQRWARELAERKITLASSASGDPAQRRVQWYNASGAGWPPESRQTPEGTSVTLASSFPLGETVTDTLRSEPFTAPEEISFWLAGHNGHPDQDDHRRNRIELIVADTGQVLHTAFPPRRDAVERIQWDCRAVEGRAVQIRCIDADSGSAYAWIAFGGFDPVWLEPGDAADHLHHALELIDSYRLGMLRDPLVNLVRSGSLSNRRRASVAEVIARLDDNPQLAALLSAGTDTVSELPVIGSWIEAAIVGDPLDYAKELAILSRSLSTADQHRVARQLAASRDTAILLVEGIGAGHLAPDVLLDKAVESGLDAVASDALRAQIEELRSRATPTDQAAAEAIEQSIIRLGEGAVAIDRGRALFTKGCAACHQLAGQGEIIGPQLDGVGNRGPRRLLEDIVTPDRNVDEAFRTTTLLTLDGVVLTGLVRSEDDSQLVLALSDGKLSTVAVEDIELRREGGNSLMPSNFHETLTAEDLASLVAYLQQHAGQK